MDRQYIRDNGVIERYLSGALTADEEQAFEEAYLGDSELLDQLQAAERLRDGMKGLDSAGDLRRSRPRWQQTFASPRYALAASLLLAVSLGFSSVLYRENRSLRSDQFSLDSMITQATAIEAVRGSAGAEITAPQPNEWRVLLLDGGTIAYDTYRATLARRGDEGAEQIWSGADLTLQLDGRIWVGVPGRVLRPGTYEVRVEGRMNDWPSGRFEEATRIDLEVAARQ
jgi:hypothetical protein